METPTPDVRPPNPVADAQPMTPAAAPARIRTICDSPRIGAGEKYGAILEVLDSLRTTAPGSVEGGKGMLFEPLLCPECGEMARGTVETISDVAEFDAHDDGSVTYNGHTDVWWEEQRTIEDEGGNVRLICYRGHDWSARGVEGRGIHHDPWVDFKAIRAAADFQPVLEHYAWRSRPRVWSSSVSVRSTKTHALRSA